MPVIGRDAGTAAVTAVMDRARDGVGGALLITGEPGIGKTARLEHPFTGRPAAGFRVRTTTAGEHNAHLPFAGLSRLPAPVRSHGTAPPPAQLATLTGAVEAESRPVDAGNRDADAGNRDADPFLVALATLDLLAEVAAQRPVPLVVEDPHRLDAAGAAVPAFVARGLTSDPIPLTAADDPTDRETGEKLCLSHRTVGDCLHRVLPKLGVTSRTALAQLLRPAG
ncbi:AAA family ATPase [Streptomyces graminilatus]|uniref:AAA family ATPase n=1 Tax=Streptomyces graminilatus TaxID=1464070 RepID=UPI0006E334BA|nr:AAA family ATPase [Streptomyces graminilatus]